jgi:hypothetical protein
LRHCGHLLLLLLLHNVLRASQHLDAAVRCSVIDEPCSKTRCVSAVGRITLLDGSDEGCSCVTLFPLAARPVRDQTKGCVRPTLACAFALLGGVLLLLFRCVGVVLELAAS